MNELAVREIDVSGLPPPEPFEHIMLALDTLPEGATLRVLIHREPYPLYEILRETGYDWQTSALADGNFAILISHTNEQGKANTPDNQTGHARPTHPDCPLASLAPTQAREAANVSLRELDVI